MATKGKEEEPALGVPYGYAYGREAPPLHPQPQPQVYYVGQNPYQAGAIPPNAVYGDPKGILLLQTMYRDTPAPFQCVYCGSSGLTTVRFGFSPLTSTILSLFPQKMRPYYFDPSSIIEIVFSSLDSVGSVSAIRMVFLWFCYFVSSFNFYGGL